MSRDAQTFQVSQFILKATLFRVTFLYKLTLSDMSTLQRMKYGKDQTELLHSCKSIHIYNTDHVILSLLMNISLNSFN
jgi:hypothetical protein